MDPRLKGDPARIGESSELCGRVAGCCELIHAWQLDTVAGKGQVMVEGWLSRGQSQGQTEAHPHLPGLRAWDRQGPCGSEMPPWPLQ